MWLYDGDNLTHREPLVDTVDLERVVNLAESMMQPVRDVMWILAGRTDSNLPKIKKLLHKYNLKNETYYLIYNTKSMTQYGHFS